jgi:poly-gamma-glutamate capsule biosynthesis protein CapA/YwtB (metallophosphatase superfamily)
VLLGGQHLLDLGGQRLEARDQALAVARAEIADAAEGQGEQRERGERAGERLGGGDRDLGAGCR